MKRLSICVPTYQRPEMIREMLIRCSGIYSALEIDIYIYDSSPGTETESEVLKYQAEYKNIHYKHLSSDIHSNMKVLEAYREIIGLGKYAYCWLCPDYVQLTMEGAECVLDHCKEGFDICVLNYRDVEHIGEKEYTDINQFFLDCAWHMTSYMATIIRLSSFTDVDWERFYERYTSEDRISLSHVGLYFEECAKISDIRAVHVPVSSKHIRISPYREESFWKQEVFSIWCDSWTSVVQALPDIYTYKDKVIKKLGVNTGIFSWKNFILLRKENIYDLHIYHQYRKFWKKVTDVPNSLLWLLAVMPAKAARLLDKPGLKHSFVRGQLRAFCAKHAQIYIYGCGFMAKKVSVVLDKLQVKYCGYIVSDRSSEKETFNGLPVIEMGEVPKNANIGIIIALNKENTMWVLENMQELRAYEVLPVYRYEDVLKD